MKRFGFWIDLTAQPMTGAPTPIAKSVRPSFGLGKRDIRHRPGRQFTFHFQDFVNKILGVTSNPNLIFPSLPDGVGANVNAPQETDIRKWQFRDDFSFQRGRHAVKIGVDETYMSKFGGSFFFGAFL